jgi:lambda family phage portal protein
MSRNIPVLYDAHNRPIPINKLRGKEGAKVKAFMSGFKGANDANLNEWAYLPVEINTMLRNDLAKLRARSRDLARNDDTCRRFLSLLKQNVLGHLGIILQAKNKTSDGGLDTAWNGEIEREYKLFARKRRSKGRFESPSACGQLTLLEIAWLSLWSRAIDGECFIQILHGYPHNRHRFAVRFLNPDLLDSSYCVEAKNGNRVEMGIEFDEFDRPVAYHFNEAHPVRKRSVQKRVAIPASQIIHIYRREYVGQLRGIPDFAAIMHKAKMLNGVHEAIVVGWRVAASKMGFFTSSNPEFMFGEGDGETERFDATRIDATPGSFDMIPQGLDLKLFDPDYPSSTYAEGHKTFMQQLANGLNVSSPTLSNNYEGVTYSSLRQALLEDREGWRCIQREMIDGFYQPIFDEWYDWTVNITGQINISAGQKQLEPTVVWYPRGWAWIDPLKEITAKIKARDNNLCTNQSILADTSGEDFLELADAIAEENRILKERGLTSELDKETATTTTDNEDAINNEQDDE